MAKQHERTIEQNYLKDCQINMITVKYKKIDALCINGNVRTKDNHLLTCKQLEVLYNYYDYDVDEMIANIKNNNYKEVSKMIGDALSNRKPYYNPYEDDWGDR